MGFAFSGWGAVLGVVGWEGEGCGCGSDGKVIGVVGVGVGVGMNDGSGSPGAVDGLLHAVCRVEDLFVDVVLYSY